MRRPWRRATRHRSPTIAGRSAIGRRAENQDRWAAGPGWAVVCDGVGGHAGGAIAAQLAIDVVVAHLADPPTTEAAVRRLLEQAVTAANTAVAEGRAAGPAVADMATTVTAAVGLPGRGDRRRWVVVQVGDSPAWRVGTAAARSITWDHNLVGELIRAGTLSPSEAIGHRGRHVVTRALGVAPTVEPELFTVDLAPDETLVLATDGLSDVAQPGDAIPVCTKDGRTLDAKRPHVAERVQGSVETTAAALVALALDRGTMDNVTVVVAR